MRLCLPLSLPSFRKYDPLEDTFYRMPLPETAIELSSVEGKKRFRSALVQGNAEAFFPLIGQFQTQAHPAFCGLTSLCVVLNTLQIDPQRVWMLPWRWFMEPMLECCFDMEKVKTCGVTVDQVAHAARLHGASVQVMRRISVDVSRNVIRQSVRGREDGSFEFVIASYDRQAVDQTGTGHFSPIAAYDSISDSVLVLDVARFKYGPHWLSLKDLAEATKLQDPDVGMPRGFLVIKKDTSETPNDTHNTRWLRKGCVPTRSLVYPLTLQSVLVIAGMLVIGVGVAMAFWRYKIVV